MLLRNKHKLTTAVEKGTEFFDRLFWLFFNFGTGIFIGVIFSLSVPYDWSLSRYDYVDRFLSGNCTGSLFIPFDPIVCSYNCKQCARVGGMLNERDECVRNNIKDAIAKWKCKVKKGQWIELHGCQFDEEPKEDF